MIIRNFGTPSWLPSGFTADDPYMATLTIYPAALSLSISVHLSVSETVRNPLIRNDRNDCGMSVALLAIGRQAQWFPVRTWWHGVAEELVQDRLLRNWSARKGLSFVATQRVTQEIGSVPGMPQPAGFLEGALPLKKHFLEIPLLLRTFCMELFIPRPHCSGCPNMRSDMLQWVVSVCWLSTHSRIPPIPFSKTDFLQVLEQSMGLSASWRVSHCGHRIPPLQTSCITQVPLWIKPERGWRCRREEGCLPTFPLPSLHRSFAKQENRTSRKSCGRGKPIFQKLPPTSATSLMNCGQTLPAPKEKQNPTQESRNNHRYKDAKGILSAYSIIPKATSTSTSIVTKRQESRPTIDREPVVYLQWRRREGESTDKW